MVDRDTWPSVRGVTRQDVSMQVLVVAGTAFPSVPLDDPRTRRVPDRTSTIRVEGKFGEARGYLLLGQGALDWWHFG